MTGSSTALERIRGKVGLWAFAHDLLEPKVAGTVAQRAERAGFAAYWYPEAYGREALTSGALLLNATSDIVVGSSIASIWARDAMSAMNGARTLEASSDDRFVLGLGVSHQPLVEHVRGHDYAKPVAHMARFLDALNEAAMVAPEADRAVPRLIAALGPAMLELAASKADGAMPYLVTPEHTEFARATMGSKAFLVVEQAVALTSDRTEFAARAAQHLERYTGLPNYQNNWKRLGFTDDDFVKGGSSRLQEALVVHGDVDRVAACIDAHRQAGADHVALQILGPDPMSIPEGDWLQLGALNRS
jgi:probable F420-dependent oxidoreductase